jgi:hypothetical protein
VVEFLSDDDAAWTRVCNACCGLINQYPHFLAIHHCRARRRRRRRRGGGARKTDLPACLPGEERKVRAIRGKGGYLHVFKVRAWNGWLHVSILESILKMAEEEVVGVM